MVRGGNILKEDVIRYKDELAGKLLPSSVNTKLAALNGFFDFLGLSELKVRPLKVQRPVFCDEEKELTKQEYYRLIKEAERLSGSLGKSSLILQTICSTGIRVSELKFITVGAVKRGQTQISLKGKCRMILLPEKLCRKLSLYIRRNGIRSGSVFVSGAGLPLSRSTVWKLLKKLCGGAKVSPSKVYPHNLRHLFARCFYEMNKDIAKLADILGHSSINTTRIYITQSGREHRRQMEKLGLVIP